MKFDKGMKAYYADVGKALAHRLSPSTKLNQMIKDGNPKPLRDWLKKSYMHYGYVGNGINFSGSANCIEIYYKDSILNNNGDKTLTVSWSQLATLLRDDNYRDKYVFPKEDTQMARKMQFDMAITQDMQSAASDSFSDNIKMIDINEISPSASNFYELSDIELLADDIEREGLKHNLVVYQDSDTGIYKVISGHRRLAAIKRLINDKRRTSTKIPCYVSREKSSAESQFDLIMLNATQRKYTDADIMREYEEIERTLKALEAEGKPIKGRMRERIAEILKVSPAQVGKIENIKHNAIDEIHEAVKSGEMSISTANEVAKLSEEKQAEIAKTNPTISHKEVKQLKQQEATNEIEKPEEKIVDILDEDIEIDEPYMSINDTDDVEDEDLTEKSSFSEQKEKAELKLSAREVEVLGKYLDDIMCYISDEDDSVFSELSYKVEEFLNRIGRKE